MQLKKYNEYKCEFRMNGRAVVLDDNGLPIIVKKELTSRSPVTITDMQAAHYNRRTAKASGIFYILAESKEEPEAEPQAGTPDDPRGIGSIHRI